MGEDKRKVIEPELVNEYAEKYSEKDLLEKLAKYAKDAGYDLIYHVIKLWILIGRPLPAGMKAAVMGALAYFVFPLDVIPDLAPIIGYSDDLAMILAVLGIASQYVTPEVEAEAKRRIQKYFGTKD